MGIPRIESVSASDKRNAINTIVLGFSADPITRWLWPDASTYLETMAEFTEAFAGKAFEEGSAYVAEEGKAAALWLPPGVDPDVDWLADIVERTIAKDMRDDVQSVLEQMDTLHPHDEPCWYLPLIAADPAHTGKGLGGALMKHALRRCDEDGCPAYLESSNPRNMSLYLRHGFEVVGEIQAGTSPTGHAMLRPAAS